MQNLSEYYRIDKSFKFFTGTVDTIFGKKSLAEGKQEPLSF